MTAFTIPIVDDRTFLVIPKPEVKDTLYDQVQKVLRPFSLGLWGLILGIIAFTSLLSVWFGEKRTPQSSPRSTGWSRRRFMRVSRWRERRRPSAYARLCLDSCLRQGMVSNCSRSSMELVLLRTHCALICSSAFSSSAALVSSKTTRPAYRINSCSSALASSY